MFFGFDRAVGQAEWVSVHRQDIYINNTKHNSRLLDGSLDELEFKFEFEVEFEFGSFEVVLIDLRHHRLVVVIRVRVTVTVRVIFTVATFFTIKLQNALLQRI